MALSSSASWALCSWTGGGATRVTSLVLVGSGQALGYQPDNLAALDFESWSDMFVGWQLAVRAMPWVLGDLFNLGERLFGEPAYGAIIDDSGVGRATIRNYAWACRQVPLARRRADLSFSHHYEVAGLPAELADDLLDRAAANSWARRELRAAVAAHHAGMMPGGEEIETDGLVRDSAGRLLPHCPTCTCEE